MASRGDPRLEHIVPSLRSAAEPVVIPVAAGAVRVLPRWCDDDEVARWRLRYRARGPADPAEPGEATWADGGPPWAEVELQSFSRELPLTGLSCGEVHYFAVALFTASGWSDWSRAVGCVPPAPQLPGKCAAVSATVQDGTTALVRWTPPIDSAAAASCGEVGGYRLLVTATPQLLPGAPEDRSCRREIAVDRDADRCEVCDLECEVDYRFQVAARNVTGWGDYSDPSPTLAMPLPVPPALPPPSARRPTHHRVTLQWQRPPSTPSAPVESFGLRYTASADWRGGGEEVQGVAGSLSEYVVGGLRPGQVYLFQARALNRYGTGPWSESSAPVRTADGREPSKIEGLSVPSVYRSFVTLRWLPAEENGFAVTGHVLRYAEREDMGDSIEVSPVVARKAGFDTCDLRHLKKTQHHFQVAAVNEKGASEWSDPVSIDLTPLPTEAALTDAPRKAALKDAPRAAAAR